MHSVGRIELVRSGICIVKGLQDVGLGNVVLFSSGGQGFVLGFNRTEAEVIVLDEFAQVRKGDLVRIVKERMSIGVNESLLGRVINPLGDPLDGLGAVMIGEDQFYPVEAPAKPVFQRRIIDKPLQTGYLTIDSQIPIGLGQRELLLGEKKSGQSDLAIDIICNQARLNTDTVCVYVGIDADTSGVKRRIERLEEQGGLSKSVVVVGRAAEAASLNYIAPMVGMTIAEWFAAKGRNVLIVFDNLTKHAKVYRHISLLLERPASREAYPGDIFYLHSRLLERAGAFSEDVGGGTITALPIVETQTEDITDFVTTNLMSITDGHVLFRQTLANKGLQPPIDNGFSVSRVGSKAQSPLVRILSEKLKGIIIRYESIVSSMSFGSYLGDESLTAYELGVRAELIMQQRHDDHYDSLQQCLLMYFVISQRINRWDQSQIKELCRQLLDYVSKPPYDLIYTKDVLDMPYEHAEVVLKRCIDDFAKDPATLKPTEKSKRIVAEIESLDGLLSNNEEILT